MIWGRNGAFFLFIGVLATHKGYLITQNYSKVDFMC
jgi:hypothetical protein